jgi:hypothetical protein
MEREFLQIQHGYAAAAADDDDDGFMYYAT